MASESVATAHQAVRDALGEWPEDVISQLESASNALFWIEAILRIASKQENQGPHTDAARMVEAARYIANDFANLADCERETMCDHLREFDATTMEARA